MVGCDCFSRPALANTECTDVALAASHGGSWRRLQTSQFVHGGPRSPVNPSARQPETPRVREDSAAPMLRHPVS